jgi:hypothetical protein
MLNLCKNSVFDACISLSYNQIIKTRKEAPAMSTLPLPLFRSGRPILEVLPAPQDMAPPIPRARQLANLIQTNIQYQVQQQEQALRQACRARAAFYLRQQPQ